MRPNHKVEVRLLPNLGSDQKELAYKIMGYVYMPAFYSDKHSINYDRALELLAHKLCSPDLKIQNIMY